MDNKNKIDIGIATLRYTKEGELVSAAFEPLMMLKACDKLIDQMKENNNKALGPINAIENAEFIFASWFSKMNEIELADRSEYTITTEEWKIDETDSTCNEYKFKFVFDKLPQQKYF